MKKNSILPKIHRKIPGKNLGFTLLEVLISIVIGGIILASAMSAYGSFTKASQAISLAQKLEKQTTFALTRISDRIRNHSIGYEHYGNYNPGSTENRLFLGDQTEITFEDENLFMNGEPFFSQEFFVKKAQFLVSPPENPFSKTLSNIDHYIQPKVSISLDIESRKDPGVKNSIQTTISSRIYE